MSLPIYVVDAFTDRPFAGNPAAICLLDAPADAAWMQRVAAEMNLSETAFLVREGEGFRLRWFTPEVEVDLCGHATLAAAHVLWSERLLPVDQPARFWTRSGELVATRAGARIELDFPALPVEAAVAPAALVEALGVSPIEAARRGDDWLLVLESEAEVRALRPDFGALRKLGCTATVTARGGEVDFVSRFFAPGKGIDEDPVTGSAHCRLAPFWAARIGRSELEAFQASPRGGRLTVRVEGERVRLGGEAVIVLRGQLAVPRA